MRAWFVIRRFEIIVQEASIQHQDFGHELYGMGVWLSDGVIPEFLLSLSSLAFECMLGVSVARPGGFMFGWTPCSWEPILQLRMKDDVKCGDNNSLGL